ncbi:MAG: type I glyceraldehyde-3-phosphate dehydrogenase [Candidatus Staskawiczbacteria bacterium CG10_big_fil_rev_8_21_14_0_10_38_10]|uniref:Type I glyceraldehyde-3-phosphate dehydrogenase n=1 Tax=Candidatus Staskawiczbacteria bacterium CG10_big_fil_rev_8_21_14_0_10_38_10 TaxID=1974891 RepID=A0A2H9T199_9BACT|nr:MAG: type I glyceraldehyde-3-phosphate dehydrogenase [Candidatus Staskawiczbacteria bacterium CG10_big_fil_rev_8_21_14_0_10_38_10]
MIKIAINGFGRIGRPVFRRIFENHPNCQVLAINDLADPKTLAHLLKYDSVYRNYPESVNYTENSLVVGRGTNKKIIKIFAEKNPEKLPWKKLGIDVVLECTGQFTDLAGAKKHLTAGAKSVIISAPAKDSEIPSYILGINEEKFNPKRDRIVDMGSCTTNCLAPIVKVLNDNFAIVKGFMTTTHSYTNDQRILDLPHKDLRRARAAALNIIPTTTGAAKAIGKAIPELAGKLDGVSFRVPTPTVSILDLIIQVSKSVSAEEVNEAFRKAQKKLKGILRVEENSLVSSDFIGDTYSAVVDAQLTMAKDNLIKVVGWYDNEYAYACRMAEFAEYIGKKI